MKIKSNKGITLIALIITIIVMLILAGVAIGSINGVNLFGKAKQATEIYNNSSKEDQNQIDDVIDILDNINNNNNNNGSDSPSTPPTPSPQVPDLNQGDVVFTYAPNSWTNSSVTVTVDVNIETTGNTIQYATANPETESSWHTYPSEGVEYFQNGSIYIRLTDGTNSGEYATGSITNIDKAAPVVGTVTSTTNSVTFNATDVGSGINGYIVNTSSTAPTSGWTSVAATILLGNTTVTGLAANTTYYVWVRDQVGNVNEAKSITTGAMTGLTTSNTTFTYAPSTWTNGNVTVTISTTVTGYTLQYSVDGSNWANYTAGISYATNGAVYARLTDGINVGSYATGNITNIDKTVPVVGTVTSTTNSVTFNATDVGSGINQYVVSTSSTAPASGWIGIAATTSLGNTTVAGLTQNTTYYVWVKDQAGNVNVARAIQTAVAFMTDGTWDGVVNAPKLGAGMTPIAWDGGNNEYVPTTNADWYNYVAQPGAIDGKTSRWANAKTSDGSYWVWIPRYEYRITSGEGTAETGTIDVRFIPITQTAPDPGYKIIPAFQNGSDDGYAMGEWKAEIAGIWVAKYLASGYPSIKSIPGVYPQGAMVGDAYTLSYNFNRALESHLIKNSEYGAMLYLAHSQYGRNARTVTDNNGLLTGGGDYIANTNQSSTGNVTGIYDLFNGPLSYDVGPGEFVADYYESYDDMVAYRICWVARNSTEDLWEVRLILQDIRH